MHPYRSLLFVPGSDAESVAAAESAGADAVVIDLEDGVAPADKDAARVRAIDALANWSADVPVGVRVNGIDTTRGIADIRAVVAADTHPAFLAVPDVRGPGDLTLVAEALDGTDIDLLPLIERPSAVFAVHDIAHVTPRVFGLLFAAIDLQRNLGMSVLGESDLSVPRALVSMAASAAGLLAFDKPLLVDDEDRLAREVERARELGYDGKLAVTPEQAARINEVFTPSEAELDEARRIIESFEAADTGLVKVNGTFVDKPVIDQLRDRIALADAVDRE